MKTKEPKRKKYLVIFLIKIFVASFVDVHIYTAIKILDRLIAQADLTKVTSMACVQRRDYRNATVEKTMSQVNNTVNEVAIAGIY